MQPEYIEDFTIDPDTAVKHKAACVWTLVGENYSMEQLDQYCSLYGISAEQALRFPPSTPSQP